MYGAYNSSVCWNNNNTDIDKHTNQDYAPNPDESWYYQIIIKSSWIPAASQILIKKVDTKNESISFGGGEGYIYRYAWSVEYQ